MIYTNNVYRKGRVMETKNLWPTYTEDDLKKLNELSEEYKDFISRAKTERLCVSEAIKMAEARGYSDIKALIKVRLSGYALLWRYQEVSVGYNSTSTLRRCSKKGWYGYRYRSR